MNSVDHTLPLFSAQFAGLVRTAGVTVDTVVLALESNGKVHRKGAEYVCVKGSTVFTFKKETGHTFSVCANVLTVYTSSS